MESEWVKIMPYIQKPLPDSMVAVTDDYPGVLESKEIYHYFSNKNSKEPISDFVTFYSNLPSTPKIGQTKMEQILEAVRLSKLAEKIEMQMRELGIKH